jgi:hypothetical protein
MQLRLMWRVYIVVVLVIMGACRIAVADTNNASRTESVLLNKFESVMSIQTRFLRDSEDVRQLPKREIAGLRVPFDYFVRALDKLGNDALADVLDHSDSVFVGAKAFASPAGLGVVHSKLCYVVILAQPNAFQIRKYFSQSPVASASGASVWEWSPSLQEFGEEDSRPSSLYASQIEQSYILVSNDVSEMRAVAGLLVSSVSKLPKAISTYDLGLADQHVLWGYRQYRQAQDVTAAGTLDVTRAARALVLFLDLEKMTLVLRLLESQTDGSTASKMTAGSKLPAFKPVGSGVWELTIPITDDQGTRERIFFIMWRFGFGAYI